MKPHHYGQKKFTPEQNYKFRTRKLKDLVVDKLDKMCSTKPVSYGTKFYGYPRWPDLDLAYELAKKYIPLDSGLEEYAAICVHRSKSTLVCTSMGHGGRLGELSGVMKIVSETTKNYIYEKMADLIMVFLETTAKPAHT
jgi:hypothetical protein